MAKFDISNLIVSPILRDKKGRAVFNPVTAVGQRLMIVPPDGKVLVVVATNVDVRCPPIISFQRILRYTLKTLTPSHPCLSSVSALSPTYEDT